ncbi:MAG: endonuclease/exonuclease/phosphatase family protein [Rhodospirillales bacterium]|jgi:endonuclease/exonuclease/phosphatase family metal-dependent hydrolase
MTGIPPIVDATAAVMHGPDPRLRAEAIEGPGGRERHDALAARIGALGTVEVRPPPSQPEATPPARFRVAAWNIERCKHVGPTAALLARTGADLLLLSEMDHGMARSGNRHTTAEVAAALGHGHAFATEFVELGLGDDRERGWHAGGINVEGLHGNAIASRHPLRAAARVALDDGGRWFAEGAPHEQRRIGGRCAVVAIVDTAAGPLAAASLHLESHSDPADRLAQVSRLLAALDRLAPGLPAVVGGDFNTAALPAGVDPADRDSAWFTAPGTLEPLFDAFAGAGFAWREANTPEPTCRTLPDGHPLPPFRRIDWVFVRGVSAAAPRTWAAVDDHGSAISDHELLTVDVTMDGGTGAA